MNINELNKKIEEIKNLQALIDEATAEMDSLKDMIKAEMGEQEELRIGLHKVRWTTVSSNRFDSAGFKKAMPDVYAKYTKTTTCRRFSIS